MKTVTELEVLACEQKQEGKTDLAEFLISRSPHVVSVFNSTWEIESASQKLERSKKTRVELLHEANESDCLENCNGQWLQCTVEVIENNQVPVHVFVDTVLILLTKGRSKYRNMMIVGPANCGKTFIFNPLTSIFQTFCNPASGSFAWVGVDMA